MLKNKKRLVIAGLLLLVIAVAGVIGWRYLPIYKLMKRPTSENLPFIKDNGDREEPPYSIYYDFEIDSTVETPGDLYKGIAHSGALFDKDIREEHLFGQHREAGGRPRNEQDLMALESVPGST